MNAAEVRKTVDHYSADMHELETSIAKTAWLLATTGSDEARDRLVELEVAYHHLFGDRAELERVREWYAQEDDLEGHDLQRQLTLLYLSFLANYEDPELSRLIAEKSAEVESGYMNFRAVYDGRTVSDNVIRDILRTDTDSGHVQGAWEASKQIGRLVAADVVRLAQLRNQTAQEMGFETFYAKALTTQEIEPEYLASLLDEVERETREPYRRLKEQLDIQLAERFDISPAQLRPWHYGEPFFQEAPAAADLEVDALFAERSPVDLAQATFNAMGLTVEDILARSDLYEREHKDQHGFCMHIDRMTEDVRILVNLRPNERWTGTILHELGHAVYDKYLGASLPFLLRRPAHTSTTEAIAMLMGRLTHQPDWLTAIMRLPQSEVRDLASGLQREQRLGMLVFMRWALVVVSFEQALYADPQRPDLNGLWWDLVERFQMVHRPDGRDAPDWAAKIHVALYPAYYQNYILGELTASQVQEDLLREAGTIFASPRAGEYLQHRLFQLGASYRWDETVRKVTGEALQPQYFVRQFAV